MDQADLHAQEAIDGPHPLAVAAGKVVVDCDDMDALARQGVEVAGERRDERFALARFHLGDLTVIECHGADELNVEMTQAERSHAGLSNRGERLGENRVEAFAIGHTLFVRRRQSTQLFVGLALHFGLERIDFLDKSLIALHLLALAKGEKLR